MSYLVIDIHAGEYEGYYRNRTDADHIANEIRKTGRQGIMVAAVRDDDAVHLPDDRIIDRSDLPKPPNARDEIAKEQQRRASRLRSPQERRKAETTP